jgi:hypothetical protein
MFQSICGNVTWQVCSHLSLCNAPKIVDLCDSFVVVWEMLVNHGQSSSPDYLSSKCCAQRRRSVVLGLTSPWVLLLEAVAYPLLQLFCMRCSIHRSIKEMRPIKWVAVKPDHNIAYRGLCSNCSEAQHNIPDMGTVINCTLIGEENLCAGCGTPESDQWPAVHDMWNQLKLWISGCAASNWSPSFYTLALLSKACQSAADYVPVNF